MKHRVNEKTAKLQTYKVNYFHILIFELHSTLLRFVMYLTNYTWKRNNANYTSFSITFHLNRHHIYCYICIFVWVFTFCFESGSLLAAASFFSSSLSTLGSGAVTLSRSDTVLPTNINLAPLFTWHSLKVDSFFNRPRNINFCMDTGTPEENTPLNTYLITITAQHLSFDKKEKKKLLLWIKAIKKLSKCVGFSHHNHIEISSPIGLTFLSLLQVQIQRPNASIF